MSKINVFDALKEITDSEIVFNLLNAYILFYNKYYGTHENMFTGLTPGNENETNHMMELLMDFIEEYSDNLKTIHENKPPAELGEYYTLYIDDQEKYYAKSCMVLLLHIVKNNILFSNWKIEFSEA